MSIYTRQGDGGQTSLADGTRVFKDDARLLAYGTVDELNSFLGWVRVVVARDERLSSLIAVLEKIQNELFIVGANLATPEGPIRATVPRLTAGAIENLEQEIDKISVTLPRLQNFILPSGSEAGALLHVCRTVCRRAERAITTAEKIFPLDQLNGKYLNRLSDYFFAAARWVNQQQQVPEELWKNNLSKK